MTAHTSLVSEEIGRCDRPEGRHTGSTFKNGGQESEQRWSQCGRGLYAGDLSEPLLSPALPPVHNLQRLQERAGRRRAKSSYFLAAAPRSPEALTSARGGPRRFSRCPFLAAVTPGRQRWAPGQAQRLPACLRDFLCAYSHCLEAEPAGSASLPAPSRPFSPRESGMCFLEHPEWNGPCLCPRAMSHGSLSLSISEHDLRLISK